MPYTKDQQTVARIAEHEPQKLFKRNRSMLTMTPEELHHMATGPIKKKKKSLLQGEK